MHVRLVCVHALTVRAHPAQTKFTGTHVTAYYDATNLLKMQDSAALLWC